MTQFWYGLLVGGGTVGAILFVGYIVVIATWRDYH